MIPPCLFYRERSVGGIVPTQGVLNSQNEFISINDFLKHKQEYNKANSRRFSVIVTAFSKIMRTFGLYSQHLKIRLLLYRNEEIVLDLKSKALYRVK